MGWPRATLSLAMAVSSVLQGIAAPIWGFLIETYRRPALTMLCSMALLIAANFLFSAAASVPQAVWIVGVGLLAGIGAAGVGSAMLLGELGRLFLPAHDPAAIKRRNLVFGIVPSVGQTGQFVLVPIAQALTLSYGWAYSAFVLACISCAVVPLFFFMRRKAPLDPEEEPAHLPASSGFDAVPTDDPHADPLKADTLAPGTPNPAGRPRVTIEPPAAVGQPQFAVVPEPPTALLALEEAFSHSAILLLTLAYFTCGWHIGFLTSNLVADLTDQGVSPSLAAWCFSIVGIFSTVGTFLSGFLPGVTGIRPKWLLCGIYYSRAVLVALLILLPPSDSSLLATCALLGLAWLSTVPATTAITASVAGTRWLATLAGAEFGAHQVGTFLGTYLGAVEYDATGSYTITFWATVGLAAVAGTFVAAIDDRSLRRREIGELGASYLLLSDSAVEVEGRG
ncbi:major facilitator superfamily domain-containing protein [Hyaloraphidium curvatum]|nr:major facilitator superfamily domain-containing protein [Hyaloraphidium curvatum]